MSLLSHNLPFFVLLAYQMHSSPWHILVETKSGGQDSFDLSLFSFLTLKIIVVAVGSK